MKVALVYDRVNKFGGAERVLLTLKRIFPEAPLYTLVYNKKKSPWAKDFKVIPTFLNKIPFLTNHHEWLAPIAPLAFETLDFSEYDVVISMTSSDAKAIITKPKTLHICLCLTPTRYFWSGKRQYGKDFKMKITPKFIVQYFRTVDLCIASRPDEYIAISEEVKKRIKNFYERESDVIYPPIDDIFYSNIKRVKKTKRKNYLLVSRLVPYKKADLAIKAFNKLGLPLTIIGSGSEYSKLKKLAKENITFLGSISDNELIKQYRYAKAVIFPQEEDFGLVPIEAQACGTPVIAYKAGGALETIVDQQTGIFFPNQTTKSLIRAINKFETLKINAKKCQLNAKKFSFENFSLQISDKLQTLWQKHQITHM